MRRFLCILVFLLSAIVSVHAFEITPAPDFELTTINGDTVTLSTLKGKVVIIDFWATWCPPCRAEIPGFIELYKKYKDRGLEIIGISVDKDIGKLKRFVEDNAINYTVVSFTKEVTEAYGGIQSIPTTFILDRNLNIVAKHIGFTDTSTFEKEIEPLLEAPVEAAEPVKSEDSKDSSNKANLSSDTIDTNVSDNASESIENKASATVNPENPAFND